LVTALAEVGIRSRHLVRGHGSTSAVARVNPEPGRMARHPVATLLGEENEFTPNHPAVEAPRAKPGNVGRVSIG